MIKKKLSHSFFGILLLLGATSLRFAHLMALCSVIMPGMVWGAICGAQDRIQVRCMQNKYRTISSALVKFIF